MLPTKFQFIWLRGFRGIFICNSIHCYSNCILLISIFKLELSPFAHILFLQKACHHKHELPVAAMFFNGSGQRTCHRCFLLSFISFGPLVSEEKIKMWKVNGRQTTDVKWWQKLTLPLPRWANKLHAVLILFCKKKSWLAWVIRMYRQEKIIKLYEMKA